MRDIIRGERLQESGENRDLELGPAGWKDGTLFSTARRGKVSLMRMAGGQNSANRSWWKGKALDSIRCTDASVGKTILPMRAT